MNQQEYHAIIRSCRPEVFCKKDVLRNFAELTGKHLCESLFFNKVAGLHNFIKKEILVQVFCCEFCQISKNIFSYWTPPAAASVYVSFNFVNMIFAFYRKIYFYENFITEFCYFFFSLSHMFLGWITSLLLPC